MSLWWEVREREFQKIQWRKSLHGRYLLSCPLPLIFFIGLHGPLHVGVVTATLHPAYGDAGRTASSELTANLQAAQQLSNGLGTM